MNSRKSLSPNRSDSLRGVPANTAEVRLEEVFETHQAELMGTLYFLLGNPEDARDALQEAFIRCWNHREQVGEIQNLKSWVFRITYNIGRDIRKTAWRRRRKPLPEDEALLIARAEKPETILSHREQVALIRRHLMAMPDEEKEVFLLRQNGDMTYDQIAQTLGIPSGTAKTRMRRALEKLRKGLSKPHS
jgi:RNA polymerase sigma-70 factor (ECF subfamily)